ncbi:MAG: SH3 domain-containing protein [Eubacteriales bacterium]|nr:SH3 domain-containing protein [Eubacteriales bacterium]
MLSPEGELLIGRRCVFEAQERNVMRFGDHPWSDMQTIDWDTLPASFEEAKAHVKPDGWAIVANPDPADRLHLRERADRGSASLGKYYNGTPVRVIALEGDWAQVVVGNTPGYMMKKYLRLNDGGAVDLAPMPDLQAREEMLMLYEAADTASHMEEIAAQRDMRVIGVVSNSFYHVWFPDKEKYGYVSADALWPGNG